MNPILARKNLAFWGICLSLTLALGGVLLNWSCTGKSSQQQTNQTEEFYTCPMHPQVVQDHPGDCPICGMKLVKKMTTSVADKATDSLAAMVNLSPSQEILAAVKTQPVQMRAFRRTLEFPGTITAIEGQRIKIATKAMGRVEKLYFDYAGATVKQGQPLYDLYSPDIQAAARELTLARTTSNPLLRESLSEASKQKLLALGLDQRQIEKLESTNPPPERITFTAPLSGIVMEKMAVQGDWVMPGMTLYDLVDLSQVWVEGVIYEKDAGHVRLNDEVQITLDAYAGASFTSKVNWIGPMLDMMTRTIPFRVTLANPEGRLKPGLFARLRIADQASFTALSLPASAVIQTGKMTMVWVKVGEGRYNPRDVQVGDRIGDDYPVLAGLSAGEEVVVEGGYLIDSDSQMRSLGSLSSMPGMEHGRAGQTEKSPEAKPGMSMPESGKPSVTQPPSSPESMPGMKMSASEMNETTKPAATELYTCPMHPEVISDQPGKCPKCGMNLVKKNS